MFGSKGVSLLSSSEIAASECRVWPPIVSKKPPTYRTGWALSPPTATACTTVEAGPTVREVHAGPRRGLHRGKGWVGPSVEVVKKAADVQDAPVGGEGVYAAVAGGGPGRIDAAVGAH